MLHSKKEEAPLCVSLEHSTLNIEGCYLHLAEAFFRRSINSEIPGKYRSFTTILLDFLKIDFGQNLPNNSGTIKFLENFLRVFSFFSP